ncbi:MAG: Rrf2 family transcriptional regulator [Thermoanaerobaculia bacterium]|nr:Rrf2 family transcriptional regulator [Thermoanaerobaculia bacterium]
MISKTARYALRILGYLVERPGERIQGEQIALATGVPSNYLSKILNQLRKQRIVESQKGWGGGFVLAPRSGRIPILDVVELFDGRIPQRECVFNLGLCDANHPCPLHDHWTQISTQLDGMLRTVTVGELGTVNLEDGAQKRPRRKANGTRSR